MKIEIDQYGPHHFSVEDLAMMNPQGLAAAVMERQAEIHILRGLILDHNEKEHSDEA